MKIFVMAKPNAKEEMVKKIDDLNFEVFVKEPPVQRRANAAIIKSLAEHFGISQSGVKMISGFASRHKIFEIE